LWRHDCRTQQSRILYSHAADVSFAADNSHATVPGVHGAMDGDRLFGDEPERRHNVDLAQR
jgi:hypothetical protein